MSSKNTRKSNVAKTSSSPVSGKFFSGSSKALRHSYKYIAPLELVDLPSGRNAVSKSEGRSTSCKSRDKVLIAVLMK